MVDFQPRLILIAGPNGAGKTTFAKSYLVLADVAFTFLNADEIARQEELVVLPTAQRDIAAGRQLLIEIERGVERGIDLAVETTLSGNLYARLIPKWQAAGYIVQLFYLKLPTVDVALKRVLERVAAGGHDIPERDVRRRFERSLRLLQDVYAGIVDELYVFELTANGWALTERRER